MTELMCLDCHEIFDPQQGHHCLNSRWILRTLDGRKMVRDISDGLAFEGREYVSLASEQLPGLSAVSTEIFNRNPDSYTASSLLKQDTLRIDKHTHSSYVIVSEKSEAYEKCLVSDIQAVPSSSQLQVSKDKGRLCQEYLQPKPYRAVSTNVKIVICNICQKVLKRNYLKKHMLTHGGKKTHRCDLCGKSFLLKSNLLKHTRGHTSDKPFSCDVCEQLPELSSVCNEIFQNIFNSSTDANLLKEETAGTDQQTSLFSGDSVMYNKCSVGDTHAVPGPSRLPFNDGKNRLCQEKFQKKPYHLLPKNVKRDTRETCGKYSKRGKILKGILKSERG
ncbi:Zinc finger protein 705F like protein [Argiope bruennichi]|uniref:Zinc finger protein 705F like protein n=1 Tax=Argiope bruennichi TaxID=94029 RepID=A0A8T0FFQ0_ARGBR|nr:Zinc finger protein 705F like protein [Argiope bruennichi]